MKVVLDTNVLISAFLWQGPAKEIFVLAERNHFTICTNKELLDEFERVLGYPKLKRNLARINKTPAEIIAEFMEIVAYYPSHYFPAPVVTKDPSDDHVLACALSANAEVIVSGDAHLTRLKTFRTIPILTPRQFLTSLQAKNL